MALKLQGVDDSLIMKIGQWTGLTFLTYIHAQIGALNTAWRSGWPFASISSMLLESMLLDNPSAPYTQPFVGFTSHHSPASQVGCVIVHEPGFP
jgi:hypothetical protein